MLSSEYYLHYRGPNLTLCLLDNEDITSRIIHAYGHVNNWQGALWTYEELFGPQSKGKQFKFEFEDKNGTQWFYGFIHDVTQYMNPPQLRRNRMITA